MSPPAVRACARRRRGGALPATASSSTVVRHALPALVPRAAAPHACADVSSRRVAADRFSAKIDLCDAPSADGYLRGRWERRFGGGILGRGAGAARPATLGARSPRWAPPPSRARPVYFASGRTSEGFFRISNRRFSTSPQEIAAYGTIVAPPSIATTQASRASSFTAHAHITQLLLTYFHTTRDPSRRVQGGECR